MANYNFQNIHILVVDDNQHMRDIITNILLSFGARHIHDVEDGSVALEMLRSYPIDIVILDWVMEPLDGYDFTKLLRSAEDSPAPYVPIIMLTAYTEEFRVAGARDAGVTEFLMKPVSPKALLARLISVIDSPRGFVNTPNYKGPDRRRHKNASYRGDERRADSEKKVAELKSKKKENLSDDDIKKVVKI